MPDWTHSFASEDRASPVLTDTLQISPASRLSLHLEIPRSEFPERPPLLFVGTTVRRPAVVFVRSGEHAPVATIVRIVPVSPSVPGYCSTERLIGDHCRRDKRS